MAISLCLFSAMEHLFCSRVKSSFRVLILFSKRVISSIFRALSSLTLLRLLSNCAIVLFRESISTPLIIYFIVDIILMLRSFMVYINESNQNFPFLLQFQNDIWLCLSPFGYTQSWRILSSL